MNYHEQLKYVQSLGIQSGTHKRTACPNCGGRTNLSVTHTGSEVLWSCFRASCPVRGKAATTRDVNAIRQALKGRSVEPERKLRVWTPPSHLTSVSGNEAAQAYLRKNNCMAAYQEGRAEVRFDPRLNRVLFMIREGGVLVDAAGRSIDPDRPKHVPKWLRYASSDSPFICGQSDTAVVVEDCASACAVSSIASGVALLGTNLKATFVGKLKSYSRVIVALDPDATAKGVDLTRKLSYFCSHVRTARLDDDLKYFDSAKIRQMLDIPHPN